MAAVLGHEIAHVVAHHPAERMSSSLLAVVAIAATSLLFDVSGNISSMIFNLAFGLPNSRTQEVGWPFYLLGVSPIFQVRKAVSC